MRINDALNLVFPIKSEQRREPDPRNNGRYVLVDVPLIWAYHTPLSSEIFQANYRIIAATKHALFARGWAYAAENGPRIAALTLRDAAQADALEWGTENAGQALLRDIRKATTVLAPTASGHSYLPVDIAISQGAISAEDWEEGESALVFFTCIYAMSVRSARRSTAESMAWVLRGSITSSSLMEFAASLQPSTQGATSLAPAADPSLVPS